MVACATVTVLIVLTRAHIDHLDVRLPWKLHHESTQNGPTAFHDAVLDGADNAPMRAWTEPVAQTATTAANSLSFASTAAASPAPTSTGHGTRISPGYREPAFPTVAERMPNTPFPYYLLNATRDPRTGRVVFTRIGTHGAELQNPDPERRRLVPSENQRDYPEPESGCGPTAILNWILWYQNFDLLRKPVESPDPSFLKRLDFGMIEDEIVSLRDGDRSLRGGANVLEIIAAIDRVAARLSNGRVRMHYERHPAPLSINDLLRFTRGYRGAILVGRPVDPSTGELTGFHAVSAVAGDTSGYVMINNWGKKLYGAIRNEDDGQYFRPQGDGEWPIRLEYLVCFTPIVPANPEAVAIAELPRKHLATRRTAPAPRRAAARPVARTTHATAAVATNPDGDLELLSVHRTHGRHTGCIVRVRNASSKEVCLYISDFKAQFPNGVVAYPDYIQPHPGPEHSQIAVVVDPNNNTFLNPGQSRYFFLGFRDPVLKNLSPTSVSIR